jgi:hypothetical protein
MRHLFVAAMVFAVAPAAAQQREKLSSTELVVQTQLRFKAPDAVVQKLLPAGFELRLSRLYYSQATRRQHCGLGAP